MVACGGKARILARLSSDFSKGAGCEWIFSDFFHVHRWLFPSYNIATMQIGSFGPCIDLLVPDNRKRYGTGEAPLEASLKQDSALKSGLWSAALMLSVMVVCLFTMVTPATAEQVEGLFEVELEALNKSESELKRVAGNGLEQVLVKVTGQSKVRGLSRVDSAISDPMPFIQQYRYGRVEVDGEERLILKLAYTEARVKKLALDAGLPLWSSNRPPVLVWLVTDEGGERRFATRASHPELYKDLKQEAKRRGLILEWPLYDLQDELQLSPRDLWRLDVRLAEQATQRYDADSLLIGRLSALSDGRWLGDWLYRNSNSHRRVDAEGREGQGLSADAIDMVADSLSEQYAISANEAESGRAFLHISGIVDLDDYAQTISYLENVAGVEHANVHWLENENMLVELVLNARLSKVRQYFVLDKRMQEDDSPIRGRDRPQEYAVDAYYRWGS